MRVAVCALLAAAAAIGQDPPPPEASNPIDTILGSLWKERGIDPAARSDDAEFLRRLSLDLTGRIPTCTQVRTFLARPDRTAAIEAMLKSDLFLETWSQRLTNALLGYSREAEYFANRPGFLEWMRRQLAEDRGWDRICSDLLTASGDIRKKPEVSFLAQFVDFERRDRTMKVEDLTGRVATAFLGVRLRCAQCHDHPSDRYTQEDFYGVVAYFARTGGSATQESIGVRTYREPVGYAFDSWKAPLEARFLDSRKPETDNLRVELTEAIIGAEQFARAFVNRMWAYFFGRGLVEPYDDFAPRNRPASPELLDTLARWARGSRFSVKALIRLFVTSETYQRTSRAGRDAAEQERLFARSRTRPLTPEQLWNAIEQATMLRESDLDRKAIARLSGPQALASNVPTYDLLKNWFLGMLVRTSNPDAAANLGQYTANVQQVLHAMNAQSPIWSGVRPLGGGLLDRLTLQTEDRRAVVDELFLATLGRRPTDRERERSEAHATTRGTAGLEDVFWALLNTDEFIFNH